MARPPRTVTPERPYTDRTPLSTTGRIPTRAGLYGVRSPRTLTVAGTTFRRLNTVQTYRQILFWARATRFLGLYGQSAITWGS